MTGPVDSHETSVPGRTAPVLLYDGQCPFCIVQAKRLQAYSRGRLAVRSFHDEGALDEFPELTVEKCMVEMKFVDGDGRISGGIEAAVRCIACAHPAGRVLYLYYIPGVRWIADRLYALTARNRYRLAGPVRRGCETGSCARHVPSPRRLDLNG